MGLFIDGVPSSHVDPGNPRRLDFEYMRWIGDVIDSLPGESAPLRAVHLGGAACTLPRYVSATRPDSRQVVYEVDAEVLDTVRTAFGLRSTSRLRLRHGEGRAGLASLADGSQDLVVRDAFVGDAVPPHLTTVEFLTEVRRVLAPDGVYVANLADRPPLRQARSEVATALAVFREVALIGEPAQFKGRRHGNLVLLAGGVRRLEQALVRRLASGAVRARYLGPDESRGFAAGARALRDPADNSSGDSTWQREPDR